MMLVVGGQGSGMIEYVASLGYAEGDIARAALDDRPVVADLHLLLKRDEGDDEALLAALAGKEAVICNEVGCGIVPMTAADRAWRDRVGRMCARLAARADIVVRMCCGIPQIIKGGGA